MESTPRNYLNELMSAIHQGDLDTVRDLLDKIPLLVNVNAGDKELTTLYQAVKSGQVDITQILIKHGTNVNFMTDDWETMIHIAMERDGKETEEIFTIESVGTLPSSVLFVEAVKILKGKCKTFLEELENFGK